MKRIPPGGEAADRLLVQGEVPAQRSLDLHPAPGERRGIGDDHVVALAACEVIEDVGMHPLEHRRRQARIAPDALRGLLQGVLRALDGHHPDRAGSRRPQRKSPGVGEQVEDAAARGHRCARGPVGALVEVEAGLLASCEIDDRLDAPLGDHRRSVARTGKVPGSETETLDPRVVLVALEVDVHPWEHRRETIDHALRERFHAADMQCNHDRVRVPVGHQAGEEVSLGIDEPHRIGIDAHAPAHVRGRAQALLQPVSCRLVGSERNEPDRDQAPRRRESPSDDGAVRCLDPRKATRSGPVRGDGDGLLVDPGVVAAPCRRLAAGLQDDRRFRTGQ